MSLLFAHGLVVDSEIPVCALPATGARRRDVVVVRGGVSTRTAEEPEGRLVAAARMPGGDAYWCARADDGGYLVRFSSAADFLIDDGLRRIECRTDPQVAHDLPGMLLAGTVLATLLALQGAPAVHASVTVAGGRATAFVGRQGAGKSTLAALMCADGATLMAEDVALIEAAGSARPHVYAGTLDLRLRSHLRSLDPPLGEPTPLTDGRFSVRPPGEPPRVAPLDAIVFPEPSRGLEDLVGRRLSTREALLCLASAPRLPGVVDPRLRRDSFRASAAISRAVPCFSVRIPWHPPFDARLASRVSDLVGEAEAAVRC